ncbi:cytochrome c-type biogenesis protein [Actinopolymorpha rutila]|uniref:Cytochrome c-type biogenesis protein n=1 Tax=Actinopolymorpha rutila TaxID=446787 RepID=A0A852ZHH9_9ACTN|nr:cytochrome c-type biogenesis protein [Actinopolymorpha rutila]
MSLLFSAAATSVGDGFARTALHGSLMLAIPIAALAGLVSFLSPCVLPLVPGYLSYVTGLTGADLASARRGRMLAGALLFVLGFAAVFVSIGAVFGVVGNFLAVNAGLLTRILGVVAILLGLAFVGLVPWLQRDVRVHKVPAVGLAAAPLLGVLFGLGWTPCVGPTLGVAATLAVNEGTAGRGSLLMLAYALGLGVPFVLVALGFRRVLGGLSWVRRHHVWVTRAGGALLILVGLAMVTGAWDAVIGPLRQWASNFLTVV